MEEEDGGGGRRRKVQGGGGDVMENRETGTLMLSRLLAVTSLNFLFFLSDFVPSPAAALQRHD